MAHDLYRQVSSSQKKPVLSHAQDLISLDHNKNKLSSLASPISRCYTAIEMTKKGRQMNSTEKQKILVVDDSATARAYMRQKLATYDCDVEFAETGEQALNMLVVNRYTCVFLDLVLPGIDGFSVCQQLQRSTDRRRSKVVMLSARASEIELRKASQVGCDTLLTKPIADSQLRELMQLHVSRCVPA